MWASWILANTEHMLHAVLITAEYRKILNISTEKCLVCALEKKIHYTFIFMHALSLFSSFQIFISQRSHSCIKWATLGKYCALWTEIMKAHVTGSFLTLECKKGSNHICLTLVSKVARLNVILFCGYPIVYRSLYWFNTSPCKMAGFVQYFYFKTPSPFSFFLKLEDFPRLSYGSVTHNLNTQSPAKHAL